MNVWRANLDYMSFCSFSFKNSDEVKIVVGQRDSLTTATWKPIEVELYRGGRKKLGEIVTLGLPHMPVVSGKAWKVLQPYFEGNIQLLPLIYQGGEFYLIRVTTVLDCIDTPRSTIERWPETGKIRRVRPLVLKQSCVGDTPIFLIKDWEVSGVCISDEVKAKIEENGLTGLEFKPIEMS